MTSPYRCPKCRALGLDHDCADQLLMRASESDDYELEVTLRFAVAPPPDSIYDPIEVATHLRENLLDDVDNLSHLVDDAVQSDGDFDVTVRPVYGA